jgi:predicted GNAT family N-acyltransferase
MKYSLEVEQGAGSPKDVIKACVSVINEGCAVDSKSAARELPKARSVAIVRAGRQIVGVGAIKESRPDYAFKIARRSGFSFDKSVLELGYVARKHSHRGQRLSEQIVARLIGLVQGMPLFATTSNETMKRTLTNAGFVQQGHEWTGRKKNQLSLWIRHPASNDSLTKGTGSIGSVTSARDEESR